MPKKEKDVLTIDNLEVHKDKNFLLVSVNPRFYNLDVVYSAIYMFLDKCYFKVNGDPEEEILVEIKPKRKVDLERLGREFNNELVNYAATRIRGKKTEDMRKIIVERALKSHSEEPLEKQVNKKDVNIPWDKKV